ncbi:MiaB/RimO family radical SAM methylthiotransferase [Desulfobaculum xiamenense]|uniref:MiaB/RimO family radical SAM methylthiotransferase n=1 Tax=Desulfobaculum xiamenense TaxID=995050 RepID=A0A846QMX9_9BACT|nr:MiaB/RimO family radical SAM methylthiotransferase [Desulfobaculum xiamenense]NJB69451.1 MiaB/RimO family radical SAM methylthiotransferase [Desulfobaculum xiamenense]
MKHPERFHIATLGCKINQYESQSIREAWIAAGREEAEDPALADVIVVNSCAVTAHAIRDLRHEARRLMRLAPDAELVITGCAAQVMADELAKDFEGARIVPQARKTDLLILPMAPVAPQPEDTPAPRRFPEFSISGYNRVRAVVKVQDGCTHRCTYCIIPHTRGASISRPMADIAAEIRRLFDAGWHEVTLSGINLAQYGTDLDGAPNFWDLLAHLDADLAADWAGRARLRISSLDPGQLTDQALDVLGASRMACPHLHVSLQSLAPAVLRRMGRGHYAPEQVANWLERLGRIWPLFGLGADFITGFPGETDEDFAQTLAACEALPLSYAHVFPYSRRPGTPAARYPEQVAHKVKKHRATLLRAVAERGKTTFLGRLAAQPALDVVVEGLSPIRGVCQHYADCRFDTPIAQAKRRMMLRATPVRVDGTTLVVAPAADAHDR